MKIRNKISIFLMVVICAFALVGCKHIQFDVNGNNSTENKGTEEVNNNVEDNDDEEHDDEEHDDEEPKKNTEPDSVNKENVEKNNPDINNTGSDPSKDTQSLTMKPSKNIDLSIYTVNLDGEIEMKVAAVAEEKSITPQLIVDIVVESLLDNSFNVGIDNVSTEDDTIIVSFLSDQPPVSYVGAGYEAAILDAIAQSLTDNLSSYNKVIYRVEGSAYSSGHIELDFNEVYHSK